MGVTDSSTVIVHQSTQNILGSCETFFTVNQAFTAAKIFHNKEFLFLLWLVQQEDRI